MKTLALATLFILAQTPAQKIDTKDWNTLTGKGKKFSLKAPKTWINGDADDEPTRQARELLRKNNPQFKAYMEASDDSYDLYVADTSEEFKGESGLINVKVIPELAVTEDMYDQIFEILSKEVKLEKGGHKTTKLPVGTALMYWGDIKFSLGQDVEFKVSSVGYMFASGGKTYIVNMSSPLESAKKYRPTFDEIAKSFKVD